MKFGYEGLGLFYTLLEKLAQQEQPIKTEVLKSQLKVGKRLEKCWNFMESLGIISSINGETFNEKLLKFSEKFQIKKEKNKIRIAKFRENMENVTHYKSVRNTRKYNIIKDNISKYNINTLQTGVCEEFSFNNQLKKMFDDKDVRMWIIASYWTFKGIKSSNREQYSSRLKRELRAATDLKGYEKKRIYEVMEWLSNNADFKWTLETVLKYIDEELNKLELGGLSEDERAKREAERIRKMYDK